MVEMQFMFVGLVKMYCRIFFIITQYSEKYIKKLPEKKAFISMRVQFETNQTNLIKRNNWKIIVDSIMKDFFDDN